MTQYGGAIFEDKCKCGLKAQMPKDLSVNEFIQVKTTITANCKKCGQIEVKFKKWV